MVKKTALEIALVKVEGMQWVVVLQQIKERVCWCVTARKWFLAMVTSAQHHHLHCFPPIVVVMDALAVIVVIVVVVVAVVVVVLAIPGIVSSPMTVGRTIVAVAIVDRAFSIFGPNEQAYSCQKSHVVVFVLLSLRMMVIVVVIVVIVVVVVFVIQGLQLTDSTHLD